MVLPVLADRIHHQPFAGVGLFHGGNERGIRFIQFHPIAVIIIHRSPVSQLVDMITVEAEYTIYIFVTCGQVSLPFRIAGIGQVNAAAERGIEGVVIFFGVVGIPENIPLFFHSIRRGVIQGAERQIVKHHFHAPFMRGIDVTLHRGQVVGTPDQIRP